MKCSIDSAIRLDPNLLPPNVLRQIMGALTTANPRKPAAIKELVWNARSMSDFIELFSYDRDGNLILPLGFRHAFQRGMEASGIEIKWEDRRRYYDSNLFSDCAPIELRDYQEPMCAALIAGEVGIVEAVTGMGKTQVALEAIRRVGQPALIIVDKASLAQQWIQRIKDCLGLDAGYVGEGKMTFASITVALRQALHARRGELWETTAKIGSIGHRKFFDVFGCVVIDEVHHGASANSLTDLIQRFPARYRWGVSATPDRDPLYFPIVQAVVGPILYEATAADAGEHLVIPSVRVLDSEFDFDYHATQRLIDTKTGTGFIARNNYSSLAGALCSDPARNAMIAAEIAREVEEGHHVLVVSRRKGHLRALSQALTVCAPEARQFSLTGENSGHDALDVARSIEEATSGTVLMSTIAEEALDIPRLDRVVLAYPGRNVEVYKQIVGRVMRPHHLKRDAVVIDIRDAQPLLRSQFRDRAQLLYAREGLKVDLPQLQT